MSEWQERIDSQLRRLREVDRWRLCRPVETAVESGNTRIHINDRDYISFAANDYLGLSMHPKVRAAAREAIDRFGAGSGASRLVTGTRSLHQQLESELAQYYAVEAALVFSSGYSANIGVITALGDRDVTIFSDELNHASIIDGCRLAKAQVLVYRHNDVAHLSSLLAQTTGAKMVVTENVFSMDGDVAPLDEIVPLCVKHRALLIVDEAHGALQPPVRTDPVLNPGLDFIRVGTLSKTFGALGGWVGGSRGVIDWLVNAARSFIFTTALTPADTAAALAALRIYAAEEGETLRAKLTSLVQRLRVGHRTPIIPIVVGAEEAALKASQALLSEGIYVPAIRPPTVAPGSSRLRVTLSALHDDAMIVRLKAALQRTGLSP